MITRSGKSLFGFISGNKRSTDQTNHRINSKKSTSFKITKSIVEESFTIYTDDNLGSFQTEGRSDENQSVSNLENNSILKDLNMNKLKNLENSLNNESEFSKSYGSLIDENKKIKISNDEKMMNGAPEGILIIYSNFLNILFSIGDLYELVVPSEEDLLPFVDNQSAEHELGNPSIVVIINKFNIFNFIS